MTEKSQTIQVSVEPLVREALFRLARQENISASSLGRRIIVKYLLDRGVLNPEVVAVGV